MTDVARLLRGSCAVALVAFALSACSGEEKGPNGTLKVDGTVHMVQTQEGGTCWKLTSTKGHDYEFQPAQVPKDLLGDGNKAQLLIKPLKDAGSFCKVGVVVTVDSVISVTPAGGGTAS